MQHQKTNLESLLEELFNEEPQIGPSKSYRWKEAVMSAVQDALYAHSDTIDSQQQLEDAIDQEIEKLRQDTEMTLEMIARSLYQVPFAVFKMPKPPSK